ncbi:MAG: cytochrome C oxidase subunit IV family protein [Candidatus Eremiobacteraeota bacterium]|nr:cytochrome C oxidase subunit IV family protein [Candidatus Eremiobacteraeota bacterium]MCW5869928.1 cytochrome C oxidase subunit IV family protein [Candidatus Eremiobacteraeota bacterium]
MTYWIVWLVLVALLVLTVAINHFSLGIWGTVLALVIAGLKALLVAVFYMHLRQSSPLIRLVAGAALLWIGLLFALSWADFLSR